MKMYKIGEISKMLGISAETIRNYEKKGLVCPSKDEESGYRYYDIIQMNQLLNIQRLHKYGYSLHEVGDVLKKSQIEGRAEALELKEEEMEKELAYMDLRIGRLKAVISCMEQAKEAKQGCFFGERPALYHMSYQKRFRLVSDKRVQEELVKWLRYADLPFMSGIVSPEAIQEGKHDFEFGFSLDSSAAKFMGVEENEVVKYYEACPAVVFYYEATPDSQMTEASQQLLDFFKKHKLRIKGESVSRVIFANWEQENYLISHLIWVPYEPLEK